VKTLTAINFDKRYCTTVAVVDNHDNREAAAHQSDVDHQPDIDQ
ncbi:46092_t:CDS:1, partial [Gigaspora margarita]